MSSPPHYGLASSYTPCVFAATLQDHNVPSSPYMPCLPAKAPASPYALCFLAMPLQAHTVSASTQHPFRFIYTLLPSNDTAGLLRHSKLTRPPPARNTSQGSHTPLPPRNGTVSSRTPCQPRNTPSNSHRPSQACPHSASSQHSLKLTPAHPARNVPSNSVVPAQLLQAHHAARSLTSSYGQSCKPAPRTACPHAAPSSSQRPPETNNTQCKFQPVFKLRIHQVHRQWQYSCQHHKPQHNLNRQSHNEYIHLGNSPSQKPQPYI